MAQVRQRHTKPELAVRSLAHSLGYRFRLHKRDLPGSPDIVFPSRRKAIFVHGCFWHRHNNCPKATTPKTRVAFWQKKFAANKQRDFRKEKLLQSLGWNVLTVWECETTDKDALQKKLRKFLR